MTTNTNTSKDAVTAAVPVEAASETNGHNNSDDGSTTMKAVETESPPQQQQQQSSSVLPHWHIPQPIQMTFPITGLKMYNSLTRQKELFIPMNGTKQITWYMYVK